MTTNYPNPVDGDVQALISDCQRDIEEIQYEISTYGDESGRRASKLKRQQVALAALMAAPLASTEKHGISNMQATGMYMRAWPVDREENERDGFNIHLYTTPPAQLLRQVELPGDRSTYWIRREDAVNAIFAAGGEVKS